MRVAKVVLVLVGAVLAAIFASGVVVGFVQADTTPTPKATPATKHEAEAKHEPTRPDVESHEDALDYCATKYPERVGRWAKLARGAKVDECVGRFGRFTYGNEWKLYPPTLAECRDEVTGDRLYDGGPSDVARLKDCAAHYEGR